MRKALNFFVLSLVLIACEEEPKPTKHAKDWSEAHSVSYNQEVNEREQIQIGLFLTHHPSYKPIVTESGLRYFIYQKGKSSEPLAQAGQTASIVTTISLLDGTECYKTEEGYIEEIIIDRNDQESGLNEGLKYMKVGDKAKLILPSHLAHGLVGDREKIPPLAILVLDVELVALKQ
jgi:FKBP-type peptidyl-prolyl cis-trans isomerase